MLRRWLSGLARMGRIMLLMVERGLDDGPNGFRRQGTRPASWRVTANYHTFKTF